MVSGSPLNLPPPANLDVIGGERSASTSYGPSSFQSSTYSGNSQDRFCSLEETLQRSSTGQRVPLTLNMPPPTSTIPQSVSRKRKIASMAEAMTSPSASPSTSPLSVHDNDSEYDPTSLAGPRSSRSIPVSSSNMKRGSKSSADATAGPHPTKGKAMSREALRKANHSLIERRRREKINFALGELRDMVPGLGEEGAGKAGEFKLEVLERTVIHMRYLQSRVNELESRLGLGQHMTKGSGGKARQIPVDNGQRDRTKETQPGFHIKRSGSTASPPSPSLSPPATTSPRLYSRGRNITSPDPNETETETNLPPPFAQAGEKMRRSPHDVTKSPGGSSYVSTSINSLLASAETTQRNHSQPTRPPAPPQATNPTLYLPFPTPSPTSPFLTYPSTLSSHSTSAATSTASSVATSGPSEPSPFLAPLSNIGLFGGALNFDAGQLSMSPGDAMGFGTAIPKQPTPPDLRMPSSSAEKESGIGAEEAANLLLAFSSPDTLRPKTGSTPLMTAMNGAKERRLTLDGEDFSLDGGVVTSNSGRSGFHTKGPRLVGKTAKDILRM